jgi:hypothetical protein
VKKPPGKISAVKTSSPKPAPAAAKRPFWLSLLIPGVIAIITIIIYRDSLSNQLLWWDDNKYVFENKTIRSLSMENIKTMFDTFTVGGYTPLVSLSLAVDYKLYGLRQVSPNTYSGKGYHLTSLLIHLLSVIVLYFFFIKLSRSPFVSAVVATLFAIHPMNVESVAWVTERKDQLYVLFYLLAMSTYLNYIDKGFKIKHLVLTGFFFLLSLFSKGMAVTLPAALFLLDYYRQRKWNAKMILEKIPFILLSIIFGAAAMAAISHRTETIVTAPSDRLLFACYGVVNYFTKLFVPYQMSVFYPFPLKTTEEYPLIFYLSPLIIVSLLFLVWRFRKNRVVVFGAAFFLSNIALILQLKPFGGSFLGDRFTYLAGIGIFFTGAMLLDAYIRERASKKKFLFISILLGYFLFLGITANARNKDWFSTLTLWEDTAQKFPASNDVTETCSRIFTMHGNFQGALPYINQSIALSKKFEWGRLYSFRAYIHFMLGQKEEELKDLNLALENEQDNCSRAKIFSQRGRIYLKTGKKKEALRDFEQSFYAAAGCQNFDFNRLQNETQAAQQLPD